MSSCSKVMNKKVV